MPQAARTYTGPVGSMVAERRRHGYLPMAGANNFRFFVSAKVYNGNMQFTEGSSQFKRYVNGVLGSILNKDRTGDYRYCPCA